MKKRLLIVVSAILVMMLVFTGCGGSGLGSEKLNVDTDEIQLQKPEKGDKVAVVETSEGTIKFLLFEEYAPKAVFNFITLAKNGYYDGTVFHRTIAGFCVQGGSPDGTATGGTSCWGLEFEDEFSDHLHHYSGAVSMANHGDDTNGSQFFFVTSPIADLKDSVRDAMRDNGWREDVVDAYVDAGGLPQLDYRYTVFGQIYEGLNVAYKISRSETDENDRPVKDVVVESVTIETIE